ncbi:MAG: alpha/beta fold hydrolase [Pseudomarimonas sp.]
MDSQSAIRCWCTPIPWHWLALAMLLWIAPAQATLTEVKPGATPTLAADEGLLLIAVDSMNPLYSLRIGPPGRLLSSELLRSLPKGRSYRLLRATAGEYQLLELQQILSWRVRLSEDPEYRFEIKAGRVNYPGDLLYREVNLWNAELSMSNRSLAAMDWLTTEHATLTAALPFAFIGRYPDPFPRFYRDQLADTTQSTTPRASTISARLKPPGKPGSLGLPAEVLWQESDLLGFGLSPDGRFLAQHLKDGKEQWKIELIDPQRGNRYLIAKSGLPFESMAWSGVDRLLLEVGPYGRRLIELVRIEHLASGDPHFKTVRLPRRGVLIDPLPSAADDILFGSYTRLGQLMVHRVDMRSQASADAFWSVFKDRLNHGVEDDITWVADGRGRLRLVLVSKDDERVWLHASKGEFTPLFDPDAEQELTPFALSEDGSLIYCTTDKDRGQRDLVAFDVATRKVVKSLFSRAGVDVESPVLDHRDEPIGVNIVSNGRRHIEYFDPDLRRESVALGRAFTGKSVFSAGRSVDGSQHLLWVDASNQPPVLFHVDRRAGTASPVLSAMPWLDGRLFAAAKHIEVKTDDGTTLDAFLTLPTGAGPHPLVVFPHGGPIGIADSLNFDRDVQFIAALGYAVLQVNFRGSDGYGRAFREAGHGNFGRLIEDDIDAALQQVLASEALDAKRMCILGASYGGYSALISAVRWPDRFRCAVSINGLSDLMLHFSASDSTLTESGRKALEAIIGDPNSEASRLREASPLYQYQRLTTPLMLVHGLRDRRVDAEQTQRLLRMRHLAGDTPVGLLFDEDGHGLDSIKTQHALWAGVAAFLRQHLGVVAMPVAASPADADAG